MTDRELLERAARAAGYEWNPEMLAYRNERDILGLWIPRVSTLWNPLADDGQALRLAVRLQLNVCNEHLNSGAAYCTRSLPGAGIDQDTYPEVHAGTDENEVIEADYAATRRAIVLAAAALDQASVTPSPL